MPEYEFIDQKVKLSISGKVVDINYARKLAAMPDLSLFEIISLDKVAKGKTLQEKGIKELKAKGLIEGRKPNFYISATVAKVTGNKADYIKQRGIDDEYCQKMILEYLKKFGEGKREDFEKLLLEKLSDVLKVEQKKNKVRNILQKMKQEKLIFPEGKSWKMSKTNG